MGNPANTEIIPASEDIAKLSSRFWAKVDRRLNGCWTWRAALQRNGYGTFGVGRKMVPAHRVAWALANGSIPFGMNVDHLCRNRSCVRPDHLEAVTSRENSLRGAHPQFTAHRELRCTRGHDLSTDDAYAVMANGGKRCKECQRMRNKRWYDANRETILLRRRCAARRPNGRAPF